MLYIFCYSYGIRFTNLGEDKYMPVLIGCIHTMCHRGYYGTFCSFMRTDAQAASTLNATASGRTNVPEKL